MYHDFSLHFRFRQLLFYHFNFPYRPFLGSAAGLILVGH
jgi:hypothetical protein